MVLLSNAFFGESSNGNWTIKVVDGDLYSTGTLNGVEVRFCRLRLLQRPLFGKLGKPGFVDAAKHVPDLVKLHPAAQHRDGLESLQVDRATNKVRFCSHSPPNEAPERFFTFRLGSKGCLILAKNGYSLDIQSLSPDRLAAAAEKGAT